MKARLLEIGGERRLRKLPAQRDHLIVEHFETFDLHLGAGEPVEHGPVLLFGLQQFLEKDADHLAVSHHAALRLDFERLGAVEQLADHDRFRVDVAQGPDEVGVGPLARARSAAQQDQFLGKAEILPAIVGLQLLPCAVENELCVFDFEIDRDARFRGRILHEEGHS